MIEKLVNWIMPNAAKSVEGEQTTLQKLQPYLTLSIQWWETVTNTTLSDYAQIELGVKTTNTGEDDLTPSEPVDTGEDAPSEPVDAGEDDLTPSEPVDTGEDAPSEPVDAGEDAQSEPVDTGEDAPSEPVNAGEGEDAQSEPVDAGEDNQDQSEGTQSEDTTESETTNSDVSAMTAILCDAMMRAVSGLDMILTPTGFAVANNQNIAPASKERVERYLNDLKQRRDLTLEAYIMDNRIESSTFPKSVYAGYHLLRYLGEQVNLLEKHLAMLPQMQQAEAEIERTVTGTAIMDELRAYRYSMLNPNNCSDERYKLTKQVQLLVWKIVTNQKEQSIITAKRDLAGMLRRSSTYDLAWQMTDAYNRWKDNSFQNKRESNGFWA